MPIKPLSTSSVRIPSSALVAFVSTTFLISWVLIGVYVFFPEMAAATFGDIGSGARRPGA